MPRKKYSWLIGLNLKLGRVEIHRNDTTNPTQVNHLTAVKEYYGVKVPREIIRGYEQILEPLMDLNRNSDSR